MLRGEERTRVKLGKPITATLIVSAWFVMLFCRLMLGSKLEWGSLVATALGCFALTAAFHALTVYLVRGIAEINEPLGRLMLQTWVPVVWVPCLIVLTMDGSLWVVLLLPVMTLLIALPMLRGRERKPEERQEGSLQSLFWIPRGVTVRETIVPALLVSVLLQLAVLAMLRRLDWPAGLLLAAVAVVLALRLRRRRERRASVSAGFATMAALLCTVVALVPFLKPGRGALALAELLAMNEQHASTTVKVSPKPAMGDTGIILSLPPKKPAERLPPAPVSSMHPAASAKERLIPFDGQYWYFREFDEHPQPDARRVQGDPLKADIHSTNRLTLMMEAHQTFLPTLALDCCSTLELHTVNADEREEPIFIEVLLSDGTRRPVSLGSRLLPSSSAEKRAMMKRPASEVMSFALPRSTRDSGCSQLTVRIRKYGSGASVASQVSVTGFELLP